MKYQLRHMKKTAALLEGGPEWFRDFMVNNITHNKNEELSRKYGIPIKEANWLGRHIYSHSGSNARFEWDADQNEKQITIDYPTKGTAEYASALAHELKHLDDFRKNKADSLDPSKSALLERGATRAESEAVLSYLAAKTKKLHPDNVKKLVKAWHRSQNWTDGKEPTDQAFDYNAFYDNLKKTAAEPTLVEQPEDTLKKARIAPDEEYKKQLMHQINLSKVLNRAKEKTAAYAPPYPMDRLPEHLKKDPVHKWRAESGIELLHREPDLKELKRIINNWELMTDKQKAVSDEKSIELFGKPNKDRIAELRALYMDKAAEEKPKHILITGHSGSGKSTLGKQLAELTGKKRVGLDRDPRIKEVIKTFKSDWPNWSEEELAKKRKIDRKVVEEALADPEPSVINGTQLLNALDLIKGTSHRKILVNPSERAIVRRRLKRDNKKGKIDEFGRNKRREMAHLLIDQYKNPISKLKKDPEWEKVAEEVLYHGSNKKLDELKPMGTHGDPGVGDAVFAAKNRGMSLAYLGKQWGDRDINQSGKYKDGKPIYTMEEMRPGALKEIYEGQTGYMHELDPESFEKEPLSRGSFYEVISRKAVKPKRVEEIKDVLKYLKKQKGIELLEYDAKSKTRKAAIERMIKRLAEMKNPSRYINWVRETNPELADILEKSAEVKLDIDIGDVLLGGRFKNKREVVRKIGTDELGQPTINGKKLLNFRIEKTLPAERKSAQTRKEELEKAAMEKTAIPKQLLTILAASTIVGAAGGLTYAHYKKPINKFLKRFLEPQATLTSGGGPGVGVRLRNTPFIADMDPTGPGAGVAIPMSTTSNVLNMLPWDKAKKYAKKIKKVPGNIYVGAEMAGIIPVPHIGISVGLDDKDKLKKRMGKMKKTASEYQYQWAPRNVSIQEVGHNLSLALGQEMNLNPTEAEKESENYKKAHIKLDGFNIAIENPIGSVRRGTDPDGKEWECPIKADYGYIKGSTGYDKDHVDVTIKPGYTGGISNVYIVNQVTDDGKFDEHKIVMGASDKDDAKRIYNSNYEPGWDGCGSIEIMPLKDFRTWVTGKGPSKGAYKMEKTAENVPSTLKSSLKTWGSPNAPAEPQVTTPADPVKPDSGTSPNMAPINDYQKVQDQFSTPTMNDPVLPDPPIAETLGTQYKGLTTPAVNKMNQSYK